MNDSLKIAAVVALLVGGAVCGAGGQSAPAAQPTFKVIGYYAEWTAARYPLAGIPADKLTHVNYAFAKIGADTS